MLKLPKDTTKTSLPLNFLLAKGRPKTTKTEKKDKQTPIYLIIQSKEAVLARIIGNNIKQNIAIYEEPNLFFLFKKLSDL